MGAEEDINISLDTDLLPAETIDSQISVEL